MDTCRGRLELSEWQSKVMTHTFVHENLTNMMKTFRYDAHPMGMVISSLAAMATFYPEANAALHGTAVYSDPRLVNTQIFRIIGKLPTIAAAAYRHRVGRPYNLPATHLSYTANLLYMMDRLSETNYEPDPRLAKALDVMFILHADHELNCSTAAMRHVASAGTDPVTAVAAAAAALYGPLHGGANEAALKMLERIGSVANVPAFVERVKRKEELLMGFGHRIYKSYDPRASIIKAIADEVFEICGRDELIEVAVALEKTALSDPYFHRAQALSKRRFLLGSDLQGDRLSDRLLPGALLHSAHRRLARALGRVARRQRGENQSPAPVVQRRGGAAVRARASARRLGRQAGEFGSSQHRHIASTNNGATITSVVSDVEIVNFGRTAPKRSSAAKKKKNGNRQKLNFNFKMNL
jgi:citrate synthase